jgi:putative effector of murein hydrolase LrgA (UPF0299 family)
MGTRMHQTNSKREWIALACGIMGVVAAVLFYWMILPGLILGAVAVVLGLLTRRTGASERASVAMALGIVAIFLVPATVLIADGAEDWGRDCALDPTHDPNC